MISKSQGETEVSLHLGTPEARRGTSVMGEVSPIF